MFFSPPYVGNFPKFYPFFFGGFHIWKQFQCLMLLRLLMADKEELERVNLLTHHADKLTKVC